MAYTEDEAVEWDILFTFVQVCSMRSIAIASKIDPAIATLYIEVNLYEAMVCRSI